MASIPVYKPPTPFLGIIPSGFQPSLMIRFKGKMTTKKGRCTIDFVNTPALNVSQDIMFHMSIRMDEKVIVRNTFKNKRWEMEERYGPFRISPKDSFEIVILAEHAHYKIAVNGVHLGVFRHRLPLNLVQYIHVKGDVEIEHILIEQDIKSAQEHAALGLMINKAMMQQNTSTQYRIQTNQVVQPASTTYVVSSTTRAFPSTSVFPVTNGTVYQPTVATVYQAPTATVYQSQTAQVYQPQGAPMYPVLQGQQIGASYSATPAYPPQQTFASAPPPPAYQQENPTATSVPDDPPPPYQSNPPPQQQQNTTWVFM